MPKTDSCRCLKKEATGIWFVVAPIRDLWKSKEREALGLDQFASVIADEEEKWREDGGNVGAGLENCARRKTGYRSRRLDGASRHRGWLSRRGLGIYLDLDWEEGGAAAGGAVRKAGGRRRVYWGEGGCGRREGNGGLGWLLWRREAARAGEYPREGGSTRSGGRLDGSGKTSNGGGRRKGAVVLVACCGRGRGTRRLE